MNDTIRFIKKFFLYLLVFLLASCGGSGNSVSTKSPVLFVTPSNSATNVSLTTNFSVGFNTQVNPTSLVPGSAFLIEGNSQQASGVAKSKAVGNKINLEVQVISAGGKNVVFKLPAGTSLNSLTQYQFSLDLSKITTSNGTSFGSGILVLSTFTTVDTTIPVATIVSPMNGMTGVRLNPNIQVAFSKKVLNVNTSTVILHQGSTTGTSAPISIAQGSNNVYVFTPTSNLIENTTYYLTLSNSITDTANPANNLAPTTFTFTTGDFTAPTVTLLTPSNGQNNVSTSPSIQFIFNEAVVNVNQNTVTLHSGSATGPTVPIGTIIAGSNNTYTFSPVSNLSGLTTYYIVLSNGITDTANPANNLLPTIFTFTTGNFNAPTVALITPSNGQNNVSTSPSIQILFSEAVVNVNQTTVTLHSGSATGPTVPIGTIIAGSNNTYTFSPASNLSELTNYYIVLSSGITDTANPANNLVTTTFTFTTGSFNAPTASITNPVNGSAVPSLIPKITIVFSKAVNNVNSNNVTLYQGRVFPANAVTIGNISQGPNNTYTFSPASQLTQLTTYYVVLGSGITDNSGQSLVTTTFNFITWYYGWTWASGSNTRNQFGTYGTQGVSSTTNIPGARQNPISWIDSSGNLWLFGGKGYDSTGSTGILNDLWKYSTINNTWTWASGSNTRNQFGAYGTQGVSSTTNIPGARNSSISWIDSSGNLWLFGGDGYDSAGNRKDMNDLWKYSTINNTWTWLSGASTGGQSGIYGTQGVSSTTNIPGARNSSISWIDSSGNLWLFGGDGYDSAGNFGILNDLWKYSPTNNTWTWVSGSNTFNQSGIYGNQGVASSTNIPGARYGSISWIDSSGNLWLFGGLYTNNNYLNDLWKYSPSANTWTWVSGSNTFNQSGIYGTQGVSSSTNIPGSRFYSISWIDSSGDLWLFGGDGYDSAGNFGNLNDLWKYSPTNNTWTWFSGSNTINQSGVYGTQGVGSLTNISGAVYGSISWIDSSGNLWLFGGKGYDSAGNSGILNNLWKFSIYPF